MVPPVEVERKKKDTAIAVTVIAINSTIDLSRDSFVTLDNDPTQHAHSPTKCSKQQERKSISRGH